MKIAIGSSNPVKINAVKFAFKKAYKNIEFEFKGIEVNSNVSNQPKTDKETRVGSKNRALKALLKLNSDFGVGLEGGVMETEVGLMGTAWCCIVSKNGKESYGGGMHFHMPEIVSRRIRKGEELGLIMDDITNKKNLKEKGGAIEVFTNGILTRTKAYQNLVEMALSKFVAVKWY